MYVGHSVYLGLIQLEAIYNNHIVRVFVEQLVTAKAESVLTACSGSLSPETPSQIQGKCMSTNLLLTLYS